MTPSPPAGCRSREVARGLLLGFEPVNSDSQCTPFPVDSIGHVALHVAMRIVTVTLSPHFGTCDSDVVTVRLPSTLWPLLGSSLGGSGSVESSPSGSQSSVHSRAPGADCPRTRHRLPLPPRDG